MAARDVALIGALIFILGMGLFVIHFSMSTMTTAMLNETSINQTEGAVDSLEGIQNNVLARLDYVVVSVFFILILVLIISGWFVGGNPIFMFIYFIVVVIGTLMSILLSNVWETVTQSASFGSTITAFPITNNIMLNLPIYVAVIGFIGLVVMFAKPYFSDGGGIG